MERKRIRPAKMNIVVVELLGSTDIELASAVIVDASVYLVNMELGIGRSAFALK